MFYQKLFLQHVPTVFHNHTVIWRSKMTACRPHAATWTQYHANHFCFIPNQNIWTQPKEHLRVWGSQLNFSKQPLHRKFVTRETYEPECSHVKKKWNIFFEESCTSYHFSPVTKPVNCRQWNAEGIECQVWSVKKAKCWLGNWRTVTRGLWSVECKAWSVECTVWSVQRKAWIAQCKA